MNIPTIYIDKTGTINANMVYDGKEFILEIEEAKFISASLDMFQRFNGGSKERLVVDGYNRLLNCILIFTFPITVLKDNIENETSLEIELKIGSKEEPENHRISEQKLTVENFSVKSEISSGIDLDKLIKHLPDNLKLKCCFTCSYSDYGVYGSLFFNGMFCFKNIKKEYLLTKDKYDYLEIMDKGTGLFFETHLCEEYEKRTLQSGYRG